MGYRCIIMVLSACFIYTSNAVAQQSSSDVSGKLLKHLNLDHNTVLQAFSERFAFLDSLLDNSIPVTDSLILHIGGG